MRRWVYYLFMLMTGYVAGVFRYRALMFLFVMELILVPVMFFISRKLAMGTKVCIPVDYYSVQKGAPKCYEIEVNNSSGFPLSKTRAKIICGYPGDKQYKRGVYGKETIKFQIEAPLNGIMEMEIIELRVYDYLSLFYSKKNLNKQIKIAVLPSNVGNLFKCLDSDSDCKMENQAVSYQSHGTNQEEIKQLREYKAGDSKKHIHWILTSKTDKLWIKEFEQEELKVCRLYIDLYKLEEKDLVIKDAFYSLLSVLLDSLMEGEREVLAEFEYQTLLLQKREDKTELFLRIYQINSSKENNLRETEVFVITPQLEVFYEDQLLYAMELTEDEYGKNKNQIQESKSREA